MWNQRYDRPDYLFGTEPAAFLAREGGRLAPGSKVLSVADGEGRNGVWLAGQGHKVTAFDSSDVALDKAWALAKVQGVSVDFRYADILGWVWTPEAFDAVVGIFIQFLSPAERAVVFEGMKRTLEPGGILLLHGYAPRQIEYATGGPKVRENMYSLDLLREAFAGLEVLRAEDYDALIEEGSGHSGKSGLIDFIARKPA